MNNQQLSPEEQSFLEYVSVPIVSKDSQGNVTESFLSPDEASFLEYVGQAEPPTPEEPWYKSWTNAAIQGLTEGVQMLGENIGMLMKESPFEEPGVNLGNVYGFDITSPETQKFKKESFQPLPQEEKQKLKEELKERFPHQEGFVEETIKRGGKLAPTALLGPGGLASNVARTGAAAVAGQTAEELGAGETGQTIAEMLAFAAPDLGRALLGRNPHQQRLIEFGRQHGLTEEQLVPAVQENSWFRRQLARLASRGEGTQNRLEDSRRALGDIYEYLRSRPEAGQRINQQDLRHVMQQYATEYFNLSPRQRAQLAPMLEEFLHSPGRGEDFIRMYQHVNADVGDPRRVGRFQEVTRQALELISPELGQEFRLANELASNRYNTANLLRPRQNLDAVGLAKVAGAILGVFKGDWSLLSSTIKLIGAQKLATEFLLNPRLQNLTTKAVRAIHNNQYALAQKAFDMFRDEVKDISPEFYDLTKDTDLKTIVQSSTANSKQREKK